MKLLLLLFFVSSLFGDKPALFLLKNYEKDINVSAWYMSEKLDGVRAYWDGKKLISRSGKIFNAPKAFTKDFPSFKLDGELWSKRSDFLKNVEENKGEGVVVRDGTLAYYTGRTKNALKLKSYIDAECEVVAHNKGQGKYENLMGSLSCKMKNQQVIKIGSGFNKHEREKPPKIGAIITFKYYGLTSKGNLRFPIFLRLRD